jgi:uncharacterized protein YjgD (DUF1641 family)
MFETWSHKNLASFAKEAYDRINQLQDEINQLKQEKKDALNGYREVLRLLQDPNGASTNQPRIRRS